MTPGVASTQRAVSQETPPVGEARPSAGDWVNLCDAQGHVQATYSPSLRLLIIRGRHGKALHDLGKLDQSACQGSTPVLG